MRYMEDTEFKDLLKKIKEKYESRGYAEAWVAEGPKVKRLLKEAIDDSFNKTYIIKECITVAGSRIVFKIENRLNHKEFAYKLSRPLKDSVAMLQKEYSILNELYHPNLH